MKSALQTTSVEQTYETFDGAKRAKTYYHWGLGRHVTVTLIDPGRRQPPGHQGYSPIARRNPDQGISAAERTMDGEP